LTDGGKRCKFKFTMLEPVRKAAEILGGVENLAKRLGCTRQAIHQWDEVPRGRVLEIEEITERKVTRHDLRPDIYPREGDAA
jgi:DNA-binding transcriptional regulator YdaS (Cro superfamily)